jgi:hypothetical protein
MPDLARLRYYISAPDSEPILDVFSGVFSGALSECVLSEASFSEARSDEEVLSITCEPGRTLGTEGPFVIVYANLMFIRGAGGSGAGAGVAGFGNTGAGKTLATA